MKSAHPFALLFPSNRNSPSILGPSRTYSACADSLHHQGHIHMASRLRELSGISTSKPRWPKNPGKIQGSMPTKRYSIHSRKSGSQAFFRKFQELILLGNGRQKKSPSAADWEHWMKHVRMVMMVMPIPYNWRGTFGTDWISARTVTAYLTSGWKESNLESSFGLQNLWCNSGCFNSWSSISAKSPPKKNTKSNLSQPETSTIQLGNHEAPWSCVARHRGPPDLIPSFGQHAGHGSDHVPRAQVLGICQDAKLEGYIEC